MKRILIAYDNSGCADAAIDELSLAGLPPKLDATVITVAEVWLPLEAGHHDAKSHDRLPLALRRAREAAWQAVETDCRAQAERAATRLRALFPKWSVTALAVGDSPARGILKRADEWKADLIVVGSHGRSVMERFFLGSVSHKVANEARCSVRIARPPRLSTHPHPRIIVAVDGSRDSEAAVNAVTARRWPPHTQFQLVTAIDSRLKTAAALPTHWAKDWIQQHDADGGEWVCRAVENLATLMRKAKLDLETHIFDGDPKQLLLQHAEDWKADCIFLGAHGLEHGEHRTLGSLASAVATRAHCSVEIVRIPV
ncbi:MAG: universal stress protein [Verrucomicrobiales bacterium]|nr:universal stress protein [Verrucomicrobiales bacterium]